jgi:hypothetical protein
MVKRNHAVEHGHSDMCGALLPLREAVACRNNQVVVHCINFGEFVTVWKET